MVDCYCTEYVKKISMTDDAYVINWNKECELKRKSTQREFDQINSERNRILQLEINNDCKSEIIELVEKHYGSGKAMQISGILHGIDEQVI